MPRLTSKFRPIHHQQLSLKPRYSAQRFQVLRSHRKNLRGEPLEATTGKEERTGQSARPSAPFSRSPILKFLRERNRAFSQLVLRLNINHLVLRRSIKMWTSASPIFSGHKLLPAQQHSRLDSPIGIFTLEMPEPVDSVSSS